MDRRFAGDAGHRIRTSVVPRFHIYTIKQYRVIVQYLKCASADDERPPLLSRMIVRLWLSLLSVNRPGLKLEQEQFRRLAARTFESRSISGGLPARLSEAQVQLRRFAIRHNHAKTRRGQCDQQRGTRNVRWSIKPLTRVANQPRDTNLLVFKLRLLVIFASLPRLAVEAPTQSLLVNHPGFELDPQKFTWQVARVFDFMNFLDCLVKPEAASPRRRPGDRPVCQADVFEDDRAAVVQINVCCRQFRVVMGLDLFMRAVMDAHNFDPLVLEFEFISLRRHFQRILSRYGDGKKKENSR